MGKVITSPKIITDAIASGFIYLEQNRYLTARTYLEYAYINTKNPDQYLLYALAITYYNLNEVKNLKKMVVEIQKIKELNEQIKSTVSEMTTDLEKRKVNVKSQVLEDFQYIKDILELNDKELLNLTKETKNNFFIELVNFENSTLTQKQLRKVIKPYIQAIEYFDEIMNKYQSEDNKKEIAIYRLYSRSSKTMGHGLLIMLALREELLQNLLTSPNVPMTFKNEIIHDIDKYTIQKYITCTEITYTNKKNQKKTIKVDKDYRLKYSLEIFAENIRNTPLEQSPKLVDYLMKLAIRYFKINYVKLDDIDENYFFLQICDFLLKSKTIKEKEIKLYLEEILLNQQKIRPDSKIIELVMLFEKI